MTRYNADQIKEIENDIINKLVTDFYYEEDGDYFVLSFLDSGEMCFRFMSDLVKN